MADPVQARTPDVQAIRARYYVHVNVTPLERDMLAALDQLSQQGEAQQAEIARLKAELAEAKDTAFNAGYNKAWRDAREMR